MLTLILTNNCVHDAILFVI